MKPQELKNHFNYLADAAGLKAQGRSEYLDNAIEIGIHEFWAAHPWSFRVSDETLDTSTAADSYDLPDDFGQIGNVRETGSLRGMHLIYATKEEFDNMVAKPSSWQTSYPNRFTVYYDHGDQKWKIQFFPRPSVDTIYYQMYRAYPASVVEIPDKFVSGYVNCIAKHVFPPGSEAHRQATINYERDLKRLQAADTPMGSHLYHLLDDTDLAIEVDRPWI